MKMKNPKSLFGDMDDLLAWKEEWIGMPEFIQEDLQPYKSIVVCFRNEREKVHFSKLIGQFITSKTKSIWYPESLRENLLTKKCIDEKSKTFR